MNTIPRNVVRLAVGFFLLGISLACFAYLNGQSAGELPSSHIYLPGQVAGPAASPEIALLKLLVCRLVEFISLSNP